MSYATYNGKYATIGGKYVILGGGGTPGPVSPVVYDTPGDYVFTVPAGVTSITVECWGGGGGSESIGTNSSGRMTAGAAGGAYGRLLRGKNRCPGRLLPRQVSGNRSGTGGTERRDGENRPSGGRHSPQSWRRGYCGLEPGGAWRG